MRELALELLDDAYGITLRAWVILRDKLEEEGHTDIIDSVSACEGRFYITPDVREVLWLK